jgi:hypothetical protein
VKEIETRIPALSETLADVAAVERECEDANVEENDYTVFTHQDLAFELELLVHSITKKITFIENQASLSPFRTLSTRNASQGCLAEYDKPYTCSTRTI